MVSIALLAEKCAYSIANFHTMRTPSRLGAHKLDILLTLGFEEVQLLTRHLDTSSTQLSCQVPHYLAPVRYLISSLQHM